MMAVSWQKWWDVVQSHQVWSDGIVAYIISNSVDHNGIQVLLLTMFQIYILNDFIFSLGSVLLSGLF